MVGEGLQYVDNLPLSMEIFGIMLVTVMANEYSTLTDFCYLILFLIKGTVYTGTQLV